MCIRDRDIPAVEAQIPPDIDAEANQQKNYGNNDPEISIVDEPQVERVDRVDDCPIDQLEHHHIEQSIHHAGHGQGQHGDNIIPHGHFLFIHRPVVQVKLRNQVPGIRKKKQP